jgi:hypothetical protein
MNILKTPEDVIKARMLRRGYTTEEINIAMKDVKDNNYNVMRLNKLETLKYPKKNC